MSKLIWYGDKVERTLTGQLPGIVSRIAKIIAERARQLAPVKTGELRSKIRATETGIEATAKHSGVVEFGAPHRAAQPFMRPAIEQFNKSDLDSSVRK